MKIKDLCQKALISLMLFLFLNMAFAENGVKVPPSKQAVLTPTRIVEPVIPDYLKSALILSTQKQFKPKMQDIYDKNGGMESALVILPQRMISGRSSSPALVAEARPLINKQQLSAFLDTSGKTTVNSEGKILALMNINELNQIQFIPLKAKINLSTPVVEVKINNRLLYLPN